MLKKGYHVNMNIDLNKKLSIIIPIYNAEKDLTRCLESILYQCRDEYEILLINDGSTDNSLELALQYEKEYPEWIRVVSQENRGVAFTRNRGIEEAKGTYIMFMDNDDYLDDQYFEHFLETIERKNADIVMGGYKRVNSDKIMFQVTPVNSTWYPFILVTAWAKIYRTDYLRKNNVQFLRYGLGEDIYFSLVAYSKTKRIEIVEDTGYNWYYNEKSVSNTAQRGFNDELDELYLLNCIFDKVDCVNDFYNMFYVRYIIWYLLFSGRQANAKRFVKEYKRGFAWLYKKQIPLRFPIFSCKTKGEKLSVKMIINVFLILHKLHLVPLFARVYCKGK